MSVTTCSFLYIFHFHFQNVLLQVFLMCWAFLVFFKFCIYHSVSTTFEISLSKMEEKLFCITVYSMEEKKRDSRLISFKCSIMTKGQNLHKYFGKKFAYIMDTLYTKAHGIKVCIINLSSTGWTFAMYVVFSRINLFSMTLPVIYLVVETRKS